MCDVESERPVVQLILPLFINHTHSFHRGVPLVATHARAETNSSVMAPFTQTLLALLVAVSILIQLSCTEAYRIKIASADTPVILLNNIPRLALFDAKL